MYSNKPTGVVFIVLSIICSQVAAEPSLTIYNQDFAVVRQRLGLNLKKGVNEIQVTDITAQLEPDSVILRDSEGRRAIRILEQNYRADPVSQGLLLSSYEGKEIDFLVINDDGSAKIVRGRIIRSGYIPIASRYGSRYRRTENVISQPVIEVDEQLRFSLPGEPLFPSLSDDNILKPTLGWLLQADTDGMLDAELGYITSGMSWEADYSMLAEGTDDTIDMIGWVTIENRSGKTFENANIKLMAGDVSKIREARYGGMGGYGGGMEAAYDESVTEQAFEDFHLYTLNRPTTLRDSQTKQVEFLRAEGVKAPRIYVYDGSKLSRRPRNADTNQVLYERNYGTNSNPKVWIMRELKNSKDNNLGISLPKGRMRFYRKDDDGQLEFTGENVIDHMPEDETVRLYTGNAFDLIGDRIRTDYQIETSRQTLDESFEIKVRNHKKSEAVEVRVVEHLYRWSSWEILQKSQDFTKTDSRTIEFHLNVQPGGEKTVTYKVRYSW
jgi:hypothetical protein